MSSSVAKRTATTLKRMPPIAEVVVQIRGHFDDAATLEGRADKHRLQAAQLLLQLRQRIEAGEEGDVAWWDWFETQDMGRGRKDCERLLRIASADDSEAALAEEREKDRDRKRLARSGADIRSMEPEEAVQSFREGYLKSVEALDPSKQKAELDRTYRRVREERERRIESRYKEPKPLPYMEEFGWEIEKELNNFFSEEMCKKLDELAKHEEHIPPITHMSLRHALENLGNKALEYARKFPIREPKIKDVN